MISNKLSTSSILIRAFYLYHFLSYALFIMIGYSFNILYDIGSLLRELALDYSSHIAWEYSCYNRLAPSASFINDIQKFHWKFFDDLPLLQFYYSARTLFVVMIVSINIVLYLRVFIKDSPMRFIFSTFLVNCMSFIVYFKIFNTAGNIARLDMMVAFAFPILFIFSIIMGLMIILLFKHPSKIDKYIHTPIAAYILMVKDFFALDLFPIFFIIFIFNELVASLFCLVASLFYSVVNC